MTSGVELVGKYSYLISPSSDTVQLDVAEIENTSSSGTTGTLRLELWLTLAPWNTSGSNTGWEIATDQITGSSNGTLGPEQYFSNISKTVPYINHPSAGTYYVTLAVAEYTGTSPSVDNGYSIDTGEPFPKFLTVAPDGSLSQGGSTVTAGTYSLLHDSQASVTEGLTETFTLSTTKVAAGTTLYYTLTGVTASEVVGGDLTGTIIVGSDDTATLPVTLTSAPGQGLSGTLTAMISTTPGGSVVASASEPLTETPVQAGLAGGGIHAAVGSVITTAGQSVGLTSIFSVTAGSNAPLYIDVTMFDRNEYPGVDYNAPKNDLDPNNNTRTGHLTINGAEFSNKPITAGGFLAGTSSDAYEESISFSYIPSIGKYYNATYGYLDQLSFLTSPNQFENTYISIYGSNNPALIGTISPISINAPPNTVNTVPLNSYFSNVGGNQYYGTVDVITRSDLVSGSNSQATPNGVCAAAQTFVGKTWSDEGCWTLASNISAQSGASLNPLTAYVASVGTPFVPTGNGEWILVYYGADQANPTITAAEAVIRPGDIVTTGWTAGGGHITTVVSGYGAQAQVIDNEEIIGPGNTIVNSAGDGVSSDIVIQPAHSLDTTLQGNGATPSTIAIYRLDTPTITVNAANNSVAAGHSLALASLFSATDAGGAGTRSIVSYAVYDVGTGGGTSDKIVVDGVSHLAQGASAQVDLSAASLSGLTLQAGGTAGMDTVYVSAYNGSCCGDWVQFTVDIGGNCSASAAVSSYSSGQLTSAIAVSDTAADITANLDGLQSLAGAGLLGAITLSDSGTPTLGITAMQAGNDAATLHAITGSYTLAVTGTTATLGSFLAKEDVTGRGLNGIAADYAGTAPTGGNSVVGFQNATFASGYNAVVLDNPRNDYAILVAANGAVTIKDIGTGDVTDGQSVTVTGVSYLIFDGGASTTFANLPVYNQIYFVESAANAQLAQFYAVATQFKTSIALSGFEYWENQLTNGMSLTSIAQSFLNTSYFQTTYGAPGTTHVQHVAFVLALYQNILGLDLNAENNGVQYWAGQMDNIATTGMDAAHALISFTNASAGTSVLNALSGTSAGLGVGWLISPSVIGGYADPGLQISAQTVLSQASGALYNTSLIDPTSVGQSGVTANGVTLTPGTVTLSSTAAASTIYLSAGFTTLLANNSGDSIHDGPGADSITITGAGNVVTLGNAGTDTLTMGNATGAYVFHFTPGHGSVLAASDTSHGTATTLLNGTTTPVQGASLTFGTASSSSPIYVNVGSVGGNTAAEVVVAANAAYKVCDASGNAATGALGEHLMFIGTDSGGNAEIWSFRAANPYAGADTAGAHAVTAAEITLVATIVGVPATSLTAADLA